MMRLTSVRHHPSPAASSGGSATNIAAAMLMVLMMGAATFVLPMAILMTAAPPAFVEASDPHSRHIAAGNRHHHCRYNGSNGIKSCTSPISNTRNSRLFATAAFAGGIGGNGLGRDNIMTRRRIRTRISSSSERQVQPQSPADNRRQRQAQQDVSRVLGSGTGLMMSPVDLWDSYNDALVAQPLLVKSVTAGVILGAADFAGQSIEGVLRKQQKQDGATDTAATEKSIDPFRIIRFAIFGLVLQAPWNHYYYTLLDGTIPPTDEPFTATNSIKVMIDQFVQAPVFTVLIFIFLGVLEGKTQQQIEQQLRNDYGDTMIANWKLWVPATVINIGFVPPILRVLYLNVVFFFWSIYLSLQLNKDPEQLLPDDE